MDDRRERWKLVIGKWVYKIKLLLRLPSSYEKPSIYLLTNSTQWNKKTPLTPWQPPTIPWPSRQVLTHATHSHFLQKLHTAALNKSEDGLSIWGFEHQLKKDEARGQQRKEMWNEQCSDESPWWQGWMDAALGSRWACGRSTCSHQEEKSLWDQQPWPSDSHTTTNTHTLSLWYGINFPLQVLRSRIKKWWAWIKNMKTHVKIYCTKLKNECKIIRISNNVVTDRKIINTLVLFFHILHLLFQTLN